ncbi:hypothetical protein [Nocardioides dilutus]
MTSTWKAAGLTGRGRRWTYVGSEFEWLVAYEGDWLGRISMTADAKLRDAVDDDYPLRVFAEFLPEIDGHVLLVALAAESAMGDDVRRDVVREYAQVLVDFVMAHDSVDSRRAAYRSGVLKPMFIRFDLRDALEA